MQGKSAISKGEWAKAYSPSPPHWGRIALESLPRGTYTTLLYVENSQPKESQLMTTGSRVRICGVVITIAVSLVIFAPSALKAQAGAKQKPASPRFEVDASWPKPLPNRWVTGEVGGTCVDAHDHVFIVNRDNLTSAEKRNAKSAPPVIEFDPEGNVVNSWGDPSVLPGGPHGCFVDSHDNVWIAGKLDGIVQKYTHDSKTLLLQIGTRGKFDTSDGTIDGAPLNSSHTQLNEPAGMAVDPADGDVYVADGYGNRRVAVFDRKGRFLRQWGRQGTLAEDKAGVGGVFLGNVHCTVLANDGLVYVCDRLGDRVQIFTKMGKFVRNVFVNPAAGEIIGRGTAWWLAFSPDKAQKYMYVADGGDEAIWIFDRATGTALSRFGQPGHQAGNFSFLHTIAVDLNGNLIAGETIDGRRVQRLRLLP
ncbi:MAG: hypothetical protein ACRD10_10990 [Terriglobia bacterium]